MRPSAPLSLYQLELLNPVCAAILALSTRLSSCMDSEADIVLARYISTSLTRRIVRKCLIAFLEKSLQDREHGEVEFAIRGVTPSWDISGKHQHSLASLR